MRAIGINSSEFFFSNSDHFKKREDIVSNVIQKINQTYENEIDRVIYFGDGIWDYLTCKKLGIEFIGIDNSNNNKLKYNGAKTVFNNFEDSELIYENLQIKEHTMTKKILIR